MVESFASEDCEGCVGCRNSLVFIYIDERYVENPPISRSRVEWMVEGDYKLYKGSHDYVC